MNENLYVKATGTSHLAAVIKRMLDNGQLDEAGGELDWLTIVANHQGMAAFSDSRYPE